MANNLKSNPSAVGDGTEGSEPVYRPLKNKPQVAVLNRPFLDGRFEIVNALADGVKIDSHSANIKPDSVIEISGFGLREEAESGLVALDRWELAREGKKYLHFSKIFRSADKIVLRMADLTEKILENDETFALSFYSSKYGQTVFKLPFVFLYKRAKDSNDDQKKNAGIKEDIKREKITTGRQENLNVVRNSAAGKEGKKTDSQEGPTGQPEKKEISKKDNLQADGLDNEANDVDDEAGVAVQEEAGREAESPPAETAVLGSPVAAAALSKAFGTVKAYIKNHPELGIPESVKAELSGAEEAGILSPEASKILSGAIFGRVSGGNGEALELKEAAEAIRAVSRAGGSAEYTVSGNQAASSAGQTIEATVRSSGAVEVTAQSGAGVSVKTSGKIKAEAGGEIRVPTARHSLGGTSSEESGVSFDTGDSRPAGGAGLSATVGAKIAGSQVSGAVQQTETGENRQNISGGVNVTRRPPAYAQTASVMKGETVIGGRTGIRQPGGGADSEVSGPQAPAVIQTEDTAKSNRDVPGDVQVSNRQSAGIKINQETGSASVFAGQPAEQGISTGPAQELPAAATLADGKQTEESHKKQPFPAKPGSLLEAESKKDIGGADGLSGNSGSGAAAGASAGTANAERQVPLPEASPVSGQKPAVQKDEEPAPRPSPEIARQLDNFKKNRPPVLGESERRLPRIGGVGGTSKLPQAISIPKPGDFLTQRQKNIVGGGLEAMGEVMHLTGKGEVGNKLKSLTKKAGVNHDYETTVSVFPEKDGLTGSQADIEWVQKAKNVEKILKIAEEVAKLTGREDVAEIARELRGAIDPEELSKVGNDAGAIRQFAANQVGKLARAGSQVAGQMAAGKGSKLAALGGKNASAIGGAVAGALQGGGVENVASTAANWYILDIAFGALFTLAGSIPALLYLNFHYLMYKFGVKWFQKPTLLVRIVTLVADVIALFLVVLFWGIIFYAGCNFPNRLTSAFVLSGHIEVCNRFDSITNVISSYAVSSGGAQNSVAGSATIGKCGVLNYGPASLSNLSAGCFGENGPAAATLSVSISGGDPISYDPAAQCSDGSHPLFGLYHINLTKYSMGGFNCPAAFKGQYTGPGSACSVIDKVLYQQCITAATDSANNIKAACAASNNGKDWPYEWQSILNSCTN